MINVIVKKAITSFNNFAKNVFSLANPAKDWVLMIAWNATEN